MADSTSFETRVEVNPATLTYKERLSLGFIHLVFVWLLTPFLSPLCILLIFALVESRLQSLLLGTAAGLVIPLVCIAISVYYEVNGYITDSWFPRALRLHARDTNSAQPGPFGFGRSLRVAWLLCSRSAFLLPAAIASGHWLYLWDLSRQPVLSGDQSVLGGFLVRAFGTVPILLVAFMLLPLPVRWMLRRQYAGLTLFVTRRQDRST